MSAGARDRPASLWEVEGAPERVVQEIPTFSASECASLRRKVLELKPSWIQRHPRLPFHSLGAANYFDIAGPGAPYYRMIRSLNPLLEEHFGWMYRRVEEKLASHLAAPVRCHEGLARPGFHIFEFHEAFRRPRDVTQPQLFQEGYDGSSFSNPLHCDKAHLVVDWRSERVDLDHPIAFTMTISEPASGAGLYVWDIHHDEILELPGRYGMEDLEPLLNSRKRHLHRYRLGVLALHSGLFLHQPEPARDVSPDDHERITLQGHGARVGDEWRIFW